MTEVESLQEGEGISRIQCLDTRKQPTLRQGWTSLPLEKQHMKYHETTHSQNSNQIYNNSVYIKNVDLKQDGKGENVSIFPPNIS